MPKWVKGQSGNPRGRPPSALTAAIRFLDGWDRKQSQASYNREAARIRGGRPRRIRQPYTKSIPVRCDVELLTEARHLIPADSEAALLRHLMREGIHAVRARLTRAANGIYT